MGAEHGGAAFDTAGQGAWGTASGHGQGTSSFCTASGKGSITPRRRGLWGPPGTSATPAPQQLGRPSSSSTGVSGWQPESLLVGLPPLPPGAS